MTAVTEAGPRPARHARATLPAFRPDWSFFLDLDGTLVDIAPSPADVLISLELRRLLLSLQRFADGAVAVISGRSVADLDHLFDGARLAIAGQHGVERRDETGHLERLDVSAADLMWARERLHTISGLHPGLMLEDKERSLALHYRAAPTLAGYANGVMHSIQASLGRAWAVQRGKCVVELKSAARTKGDAIAAFLSDAPFAGRTPVCAGDDLSDEHAFEVVQRLGGIAIKVGPGPTIAKHRVAEPRDLTDWLARGFGGAWRLPDWFPDDDDGDV